VNRYKYLFFDLDGTIIDSSEGVTKCFKYALEYYGIEVNDLRELYRVVGPPLKQSFEEFYSLSENDSINAVKKYRERYENVGVFECKLYDGIENQLSKLKENGYKLVLATSKPTVYAKRILNKFHLTDYFYYIGGADIENNISTKEEVLESILNTLDIKDFSTILMIGDRKYDLMGAQYFGIDALGVLYGFGSYEELMSYQNIGVAEKVEDICKYLL